MSAELQKERRLLPMGIQTFPTLREGGYYYVDKTSLIREMIRSGRHYFLSRPRRFGKSLLVSTLKELFEGNERLFRGLDILGINSVQLKGLNLVSIQLFLLYSNFRITLENGVGFADNTRK